MLARTLLIAALLASLGACERGAGWTLHGQAAVALDEDDDQSEPEGIAGARATLRCGGTKVAPLTVTADEAGAFEFSGPGRGPKMDCVIDVTSPAHEPVSLLVADLCADDDDDDTCESGIGLATLKPKLPEVVTR